MYDADSTGAINYFNLAKEILQKNNLTQTKTEDEVFDVARHGNS
jgi:chromosome partitioning protein